MRYASAMHRIQLTSASGKDWIVVYVPLADDGTLDLEAPPPFLPKTVWEGETWTGELVVEHDEAQNRIDWYRPDTEDSLTDFLTVPVRLNAMICAWQPDSPTSKRLDLRVAAIDRV